MKRVLIILTAVVLVVGGIVGVAAYGATRTLSCPGTVTDTSTTYTVTTTCSFPKPPATTVTTTATATVTVTVTAKPSATPTPSPTPTSSPTPSQTPTPTPTVSATPTPTPTVTPTATPTQPAGAWPDASNTGWRHTGVTLRTVKVGDSGPGWSAETVAGSPVLYVTGNGATLDSLDIPMRVKVLANNVTISRSRIAAADYYTVNTSDPPTHYTGLTLVDDELDGLSDKSEPGIAVMGTVGATYTRLDVHGFGSSGPRMESGSTLQDSWIHGFVCTAGDHSAGSSANSGGSGIAWLHNSIDITIPGGNPCASAAIGVDPDFGNYDGVQVIGNRVAGGAYGIYTAQNQGAKNVRCDGNVFVRGSFDYGPVAQVQAGNGNTFSGNTWDDGSPIQP